MGYTHYWTPKAIDDDNDWAKIVSATKAIIGVADCPIAGWDGEGKPEIDGEFIRFNGEGDDGYETFTLDRSSAGQFCKTDQRPYDVVVTAALTYLAAEHGFDVRSDGDASDWEAGGKLAQMALGKPFPNPLVKEEAIGS